MFDLNLDLPDRQALYCANTGIRLAPSDGVRPPAGTPAAVAVLDDGTTIPLFCDTLIGRSPETDHRVSAGEWVPLRLHDASNQLSRSHLLFRVINWQIEALDVGSRNGSFLHTDTGWKQLVPGLGHKLDTGQTIRVGSRELRVHYAGR